MSSVWVQRVAALSDAQRELLALRLGPSDVTGEPQLVAYVVTHLGAAEGGLDLRAWLAARLPAYMLPAHIVELSEFGRTPNGKLDRGSLPAPEAVAEGGQRSAAAAGVRAPRTEVERGVAAAWRALLDLDLIDLSDDFFELGGHSLLAAQLVARLRAEFDVPLPVSAVFDAPTIEQLAARISALQLARAAGARAGLPDPGPSNPDREEFEL